MSFNPSQSRAIAHEKGPMLVLAGPGSGKTLVITQRTKTLIEHYGVNPSNILVITFTKAAATEMQERFDKLMDGQKLPVSFGTFHAVYFKILKYAFRYDAGNIIRDEQKIQFIKEIVAKTELEMDDEAEFISDILGEISMIKSEMITPEHYYSKSCPDDIFKNIFSEYEKKLHVANLIDFDDMLVLCHQLLTARTDILKAWQDKYQYILIDEFQDINKVQYEVIRMLAKPQDNLFIVGDDDQSIYRFRGAKPEIMLNFENDYPNAAKVVLDTNYRSSQEIVNASLRVIKNNQKRFPKEIKTINPKGNPVQIAEFPGPEEENTMILNQIIDYTNQGYSYSDIAVLFRTNTGPRLLLEKLMEYNIPFRMKDTMPNLYEHWITKNILSYIHIAMGGRNRADFLQIINRPKRYVSRECFPTVEVNMQEVKQYYNDKDWMIERLEKLEFDLGMLQKMNPFSAIHYIRQGIGYDDYLKEYAAFRHMKSDELFELLDELQESTKPFKSYAHWFEHIEEYTKELKNQLHLRNRNQNSIELATMHSSKGLEYKIVFLIDANEGVTPHHKAVLNEDMEEERRMFYVGMTRAKEKLHIYSVKERYHKPVSVSRFVGEIKCDPHELKPGAKIHHRKYGDGEIRSNDGKKIMIYFPKLKKELSFDLKFILSNHIIELKNQ